MLFLLVGRLVTVGQRWSDLVIPNLRRLVGWSVVGRSKPLNQPRKVTENQAIRLQKNGRLVGWSVFQNHHTLYEKKKKIDLFATGACINIFFDYLCSMSEMCIYINVEPYLAEWIKHSFGDPVVMPKDSPESRLLKLFLDKQPADVPIDRPSDFNVAIRIPWYKEKDSRTYFYLAPRAKAMIAECYETMFISNLWLELGSGHNLNCSLTTLVYAWLERHGINDEHWETVRQKYYRLRKRYAKECNLKI